MNATLTKGMWVLIFAATPSESFPIWLWMYICQVLEVQRPNFWMSESLYPMSLSAMAPPARREWAPTMSGSYPFSWRLSALTDSLMACTMLLPVTLVHFLFKYTSQITFDSSPPFDKMWCTRRARPATAPRVPVDCWCRVWPMRPFFWFDIFIVAESAESNCLSGDLRGSTLLFLKKPMSPTRNCLVRVAGTIFPFCFTMRGLVYSPLRRR